MCNMKEKIQKSVSVVATKPVTRASKEAETLTRLFKFEESLGDSPEDRLMKVILNNSSLRVEMFNRMLRDE